MNNFNTSTSGIDIEFDISYDADLARMWWDESFERIDDGKYLYTEWGNFSSEYDELATCKVDATPENYKAIIKAAKEGAPYAARYYNNGSYTIADYIADIVSEVITNLGADEARELFEEYGVTVTSDYETVVTRGYSQGDYAEVLVNVPEFERVTGAAFSIDAVQDTIDSLFWDSPIYCRGTINGEEFIGECDGSYKGYDKGEVIAEIVAAFPEFDPDVLRAELEHVLPLEPKYH